MEIRTHAGRWGLFAADWYGGMDVPVASGSLWEMIDLRSRYEEEER